MQTNENHARHSALALDDLTDSLAHITAHVRDATGHVVSIAGKTASQRDSSSRITKATREMAVMAEENHAYAAATLSSIEGLREHVRQQHSIAGLQTA